MTAKEIQKLARKHQRRAKAGRAAKGFLVLGVLAGGAYAAWRWWDKQANPDWLVEPPVATEVGDERSPLSSVDGSDRADLDPEVKAKQAEAESGEGNTPASTTGPDPGRHGAPRAYPLTERTRLR